MLVISQILLTDQVYRKAIDQTANMSLLMYNSACDVAIYIESFQAWTMSLSYLFRDLKVECISLTGCKQSIKI